MNTVELIICTEKGYLEAMSKLLIWSLREFGGTFKNVPIYSYQPRKQNQISRDTITFFEKYEVNYIDLDLNKKYRSYPLANKPIVCAHREFNTGADYLIFLDSDIFFLKEPADLINFDEYDAMLRPVDNKIMGAEGPDDVNAPYWLELYKLLGVDGSRKVVTTGDKKLVFEYYNSGHLATKTSTNLFTTWNENFEKVMEYGIQPSDGIFFVEQSAFSATVSQMNLNVKPMPEAYNCPIYFIENRELDEQVAFFEETVSIHYHKKFKNVFGYNPIRDFLNISPNGQRINKKLEEFSVLNRASELEILKYRIKSALKKFLK